MNCRSYGLPQNDCGSQRVLTHTQRALMSLRSTSSTTSGLGRPHNGKCAVMSARAQTFSSRSEEHTSELQSQSNLVCRLLLEKKKYNCGMWDEPSTTTLGAVQH